MSNILGWAPKKWGGDCVGNKKLISALRALVRQIRVGKVQKAVRLLVTGESRAGKTATIKLFVRALLCERIDPESLDPCGLCRTCKEKAEQLGFHGLEVDVAGGRIHYLPIDCTKLEGTEHLIEVLTGLRDYYGVRVVFLDEIHRLQHRAMDEQLLKPIEEKAFVWIAASADVSKLETMFMNRFVKLGIEPPSVEELALWLADRCIEFGVPYEDKAVIRLAERSNRVPGIALQAVDLASLYPETGLTMKLIEEFAFVADA
jgi:DNA polymerase-3 subunit gamma/tau